MRWAVALTAAVLAMAARGQLDPWLLGSFNFVFAYPVVAFAAIWIGFDAALAVVALCAVWAWVPWVAPTVSGPKALLQFAMFLVCAPALSWICSVVGRRRGRGAKPAPALSDTPRARATETWLLASMWAAAILPTAMFAVTAVESYDSAFQRARVQVEHAADLANEHALRVWQTTDLAFDRAAEAVGRSSDAEIRAAAGESHDRLRRLVERMPALQSISVWDASGQLLASSAASSASSRASVVDAECFRVQATGTKEACFSEQFDSERPARLLMSVSERRERADGAFAGVITARVHPSYFFEFYKELARNDPGLSVSLFRANGTIIARMPSPPVDGMIAPLSGPLMQRVAAGDRAGLLTITSPVDGQRRLIAFRQIANRPLYTAAAMAHDAVLAEWLAYLALLAGFTFPMAFALVYVSWIAWRRTRREYAALRELNAEADKRLAAEAALRQAQKLEALGHLTGGVAHDVNNLLMVVSNNAHLLERLPRGADTTRPIASIKRAVDAGTRLTRQLLAFSRRQALNAEVIQLAEWLPAVVELLRHSVNREIELVCDVASDVRAIEVDPAELELALINLTVNARDAMPQGGTLRLAAFNALPDERLAADREFVEISVSDTGIGIAPELVERVFEPFFTTKEVGKGTGLGLSQVYGLCTQAGGTAMLRSRLGKGTTVSMFLPATRAQASAPAVGSGIAHASGRVLLVEDNDEVAEATALLLNAIGYAVERERSADHALTLLDARPAAFDVVLSDIVMAGASDGLELALTLRRTQPRLGVVLMTGYTARLQAAVDAGFEVIAKPCAPDELAGALQRAITRRAA